MPPTLLQTRSSGVEIPVFIFRQAIEGKPHDALLARSIDRDANLDGV
jgi:hypothetical protein